MDRLLSQMSKAELEAALKEYGAGQLQTAGHAPLQRPKELDDPNTPPDLRNMILSSYTAALTDRPQASWSKAERDSVQEQALKVLRGMGQ